jgi:ribulose-phosphate 3-epimerase
MIENPGRYVDDFVQAGGSWITVHAETCPHLKRVIRKVRQLEARPGIVLKPATPLKTLFPVLDDIDLVLIMSVNPGFGGQSFIPAALKKTERLRKIVDQNGYSIEIEVDGGVKIENIGEISKAGADIFVVGTGIFKTENYEETIRKLRQEIGD